jgi:hypothetical protein
MLASEELGVGGQRWEGRPIGPRRAPASTPDQLGPQQLVNLHRLTEEGATDLDELDGGPVGAGELGHDALASAVQEAALGWAETRVEAEPVVRVVLEARRRLG